MPKPLSEDRQTALTSLVKTNGIEHSLYALAFLMDGRKKDGLTNFYDTYPMPDILRTIAKLYYLEGIGDNNATS